MSTCHFKPKDKKAFISDVGKELIKKRGKRRFYHPSEIREAASRCGYPADIHCWAMCIFATPADFKAVHDAAGEACDYAAMKGEVLSDLATGGSFSFLDLNLSWLDWPDISLPSVFDWFDFSP